MGLPVPVHQPDLPTAGDRVLRPVVPVRPRPRGRDRASGGAAAVGPVAGSDLLTTPSRHHQPLGSPVRTLDSDANIVTPLRIIATPERRFGTFLELLAR